MDNPDSPTNLDPYTLSLVALQDATKVLRGSETIELAAGKSTDLRDGDEVIWTKGGKYSMTCVHTLL
jgi:hypothetical protein